MSTQHVSEATQDVLNTSRTEEIGILELHPIYAKKIVECCNISKRRVGLFISQGEVPQKNAHSQIRVGERIVTISKKKIESFNNSASLYDTQFL